MEKLLSLCYCWRVGKLGPEMMWQRKELTLGFMVHAWFWVLYVTKDNFEFLILLFYLKSAGISPPLPSPSPPLPPLSSLPSPFTLPPSFIPFLDSVLLFSSVFCQAHDPPASLSFLLELDMCPVPSSWLESTSEQFPTHSWERVSFLVWGWSAFGKEESTCPSSLYSIWIMA